MAAGQGGSAPLNTRTIIYTPNSAATANSASEMTSMGSSKLCMHWMRQAAGGSRREGRATVWQDEHQPISARPVKLCGGSRLLREPFREGGDEPGAQRIGQHHHVRLGTPVFGDAFGVAA